MFTINSQRIQVRAPAVIRGGLLLSTLALVLAGCGGGGGGTVPGVPGGGNPEVPFTPTPNFLKLLPAGQSGATYVGTAECAKCHGPQAAQSTAMAGAAMLAKATGSRPAQVTPPSETPLIDIATRFAQTTHSHQGITCENCHGPGSNHVSAKGGTENILTFPRILSANVCGQCHTQVHKDWVQSAHDDIVPGAITSGISGGGTCLSCHSDTYRVEVLELGRPKGDLQRFADVTETAACGSCHNPHAVTGKLSDDGNEVQLRHSPFNTDITLVDPGSPVDEYVRMDHTCAQCHNGRGANPSDEALERTTTRPNMHDSNQFNMLGGFAGVSVGGVQASSAHFTIRGQCTTCHMANNTNPHTFTVKFDACAPCHTPTDAAARSNAIRNETQSRLLALRTRLEEWALATFGDRDLWDYTALVVAPKKAPDQKLVPIQIKRARHNYYFIVRDASHGIHNGTYARHLLDVANQQIDQVTSAGGQSRSVRLKPNPAGRAILEMDRRRASRADSEPGNDF